MSKLPKYKSSRPDIFLMGIYNISKNKYYINITQYCCKGKYNNDFQYKVWAILELMRGAFITYSGLFPTYLGKDSKLGRKEVFPAQLGWTVIYEFCNRYNWPE